jgi:hypothetical protein
MTIKFMMLESSIHIVNSERALWNIMKFRKQQVRYLLPPQLFDTFEGTFLN